MTKNGMWIYCIFADIITHLNELNLRLQGAGQTVPGLFETSKSVVAKLDVYIQDVQSSSFHYFKNLQKVSCDYEVDCFVIGARGFTTSDVLVKGFRFYSNQFVAMTV